MASDLDRQMKEEMERASLKDVVPDFDAAQEWTRLSRRLPVKKTSAGWWRYAAIIIVLLGAGWLILMTPATPEKPVANNDTHVDLNSPAAVQQVNDKPAGNDSQLKVATVVNEKKHRTAKETGTHTFTARYMISNSTDCPMEISINQTMKCPNSEPASISTSSKLEPGQSAPLAYKASDSIPHNCSLTIEAIEIKSINTGEAITLDAHSSPSTAQEVFSYISGEKRGDVLAGVFNIDCNHQHARRSLRLDNRAGSIIMQ